MITQSCLLNFFISKTFSNLLYCFSYLSPFFFFFLSVSVFASSCKYIYIYIHIYIYIYIYILKFFFLFVFFFCLFALCHSIMWFFTCTRFNLTSILSMQVLQAIVNFLTCKYNVELIGPK